MPKLIKPIGKPLTKKVTTLLKPLTERVADAADREGIYAMDMIRYPEILARNKLPDQINHTVAQAADEFNRNQFRKIADKYNTKAVDPYAGSTY